MGNNLSSEYTPPDLSGVVFSPQDRNATIILGVIWGITAYVLGMIFTMFTLIDRWRGPYDKFRTGGSSVLAAFAMSALWPMVMAYIILSR